MTRLGRIATAALLAGGLFTGSVAAASHLAESFSFDGSLCGFTGTYQLSFIDNFGSMTNGSSWDAGQIHETFVADSGRGVTIDFLDGREENLAPTLNADGTTSFIYLYSGAQFKIQALGGPVLEQNTGRLRVTAVRASDGTLLSVSVEVLAGPNPNTTGDENSPESCLVIAPYLAGGSSSH